ncbi:predicted protein [Streptomyces sp. AA4]|nr:predicted protein [Streptomyces sp. AA4]
MDAGGPSGPRGAAPPISPRRGHPTSRAVIRGTGAPRNRFRSRPVVVTHALSPPRGAGWGSGQRVQLLSRMAAAPFAARWLADGGVQLVQLLSRTAWLLSRVDGRWSGGSSGPVVVTHGGGSSRELMDGGRAAHRVQLLSRTRRFLSARWLVGDRVQRVQLLSRTARLLSRVDGTVVGWLSGSSCCRAQRRSFRGSTVSGCSGSAGPVVVAHRGSSLRGIDGRWSAGLSEPSCCHARRGSFREVGDQCPGDSANPVVVPHRGDSFRTSTVSNQRTSASPVVVTYSAPLSPR